MKRLGEILSKTVNADISEVRSGQGVDATARDRADLPNLQGRRLRAPRAARSTIRASARPSPATA